MTNLVLRAFLQGKDPGNEVGEIRDTKTLDLSLNIVSLQVLGRCFAFFTSRDQFVAQQKHLRVEES